MNMNITAPITGQLLATLPFFSGLSESHLNTLAHNAMAADFAAGENIFQAGEVANRFYFILEGEVALTAAGQRDDERSRATIETVGAGNVLGWSWLFPPQRWHFDARAVTAGRAIFFYGTRLREECENDHDLGYELMKRVSEIVIQRLDAARERILELT